MIVDKLVKVSKEADELADGLADFVLQLKQCLKDGFQVGQDIPVILSAVVTKLVPALEGVDKLGAEKTENIQAFLLAFDLAGVKLASEFLK